MEWRLPKGVDEPGYKIHTEWEYNTLSLSFVAPQAVDLFVLLKQNPVQPLDLMHQHFVLHIHLLTLREGGFAYSLAIGGSLWLILVSSSWFRF